MKRNLKDIFDNKSEGKYAILTSKNDKIKLCDQKLLLLKKFIDDKIGKYNAMNKLRNGSILVKTENERQAERCVGTFSFGLPCNDFQVEIKLYDKLNNNRGTILSKRLSQESEDDIISLLSEQKVIEARKILKKNSDGQMIPTGLIILTFSIQKLPERVFVMFSSCEVRQYYDRPLRCTKCQKLNHTRKFCVAENEICGLCAVILPHEVHEENKCVNCQGPHSSFDRKCPEFIKQNNIKRIQTDNNWSYGRAFAEYDKTHQATSTGTFAQIVKSTQSTEMEELKKVLLEVRRQLEQKDRLINMMKEKLDRLTKATVYTAKDMTKPAPIEPEITIINVSNSGPQQKKQKHERESESNHRAQEDMDTNEQFEIVTDENIKKFPKKIQQKYEKKKKTTGANVILYYDTITKDFYSLHEEEL